MPRPPTLPEPEEVHRLLNTTDPNTGKKYTQSDVARMYGVSRAAVSEFVHKHRLVEKRARYSEFIPWRVKVEHQHAYEIRMLRLAARRDRGESLNPRDERYLDSWVATMAEVDAVVDYDERDGPYYVRRRHGIDRGLVYEPEWRLEQNGALSRA